MSDRGDPAKHWNQVYAHRESAERSWFQRDPSTSLQLLEAHTSLPSAAVIDVGAGASSLVDQLLDRGLAAVTVLDVSTSALDKVRQRLGARVERVTFLVQDVLSWDPTSTYDVWHDRAVFHFLTASRDRTRYVATAARAVRPGGHLVLATFAQDGPTQCSGLPTCRYTAEELLEVFAGSFAAVAAAREEHLTPWDTMQPFTWVVLRRLQHPANGPDGFLT